MLPCASPCSIPVISTESWTEATMETEGLRLVMRIPPDFRVLQDWRSSLGEVARQGMKLIESWRAKSPFGVRFISLWRDDRPSFPSWNHQSELRPERIEFSKCVERIAEVDVSIATWVVKMEEAPPAYDVAAHWSLGHSFWATLGAECFGPSEQEEILAMLRTLRIERFA